VFIAEKGSGTHAMLALRLHALFDFQKICLQYEQSAGQKKTLLFDSHLNYVFYAVHRSEILTVCRVFIELRLP